jgi:adenine-specific DNA-methyltransferase
VKGFVPTPDAVVDLMVAKLFAGRPPSSGSSLLDPGCGRGAFVAGVIRWCTAHGTALPRIVGVESDPEHAGFLRERFRGVPAVEIRETDFLSTPREAFDYVIGNPPYVALTGLSERERNEYRRSYGTATGRFDLYLLFFEQALRMLKDTGRLVFITPEKFLYVQTAAALRSLLSRVCVEELHFLEEDTFAQRVTYPVVTTLSVTDIGQATRVVARNGAESRVSLRGGAESWLPAICGAVRHEPAYTLSDVCTRISCGVATGADLVFVVKTESLEPGLRAFAYPTLAGRELSPGTLPAPTRLMLLPYTRHGQLLAEDRLGALGDYLAQPHRRDALLARTCVRQKPWYAFHETPPMRHLLQPKLLCKDIGAEPFFVVDREGSIVPRHSLYYLVPADAGGIDLLAEYLNSRAALQWLNAHCQRAAKNFLRLQSHVLKRLPVPEEVAFALGASPLAFSDLAA